MRDLQEELRSPINTKISETQSIDNSTGLMLKIKTWIQTWIRRVGYDYQFTQLYKCRIDIQRVHWMYSKPLMADVYYCFGGLQISNYIRRVIVLSLFLEMSME